ncbi:MAG: fasciclin domain-containing protein [Sphingobacterium sp.]|uniref:fasciclin domain-containing protein n=1 Tax=Sphingobacterium sp. JB170 TaxID=1434842 RepID=UPI0015C615D1|nr:fasciclin domain-containing protein [Sphingobacterium sp. JB170]
MKTLKKIMFKVVALVCVTCIYATSCSKDDYYTDGERAVAEFDGTVMDYLDSKPREFDTIVQIIRLAGMEEKFSSEEFTFFAPRDEDIKSLIGDVNTNGLNNLLFSLGLDTVKQLSDVDSVIWNFYLHRHIFNGKNKLADYPQVDYNLMSVYGGQNYSSQGDAVFNIGVKYNDAVSSDGNSVLKYMGYRQLHIAYITDLGEPTVFNAIPVASSDIQPTNGIVHVLNYVDGQFGFSDSQIRSDIIQSKR